MGDFFDCGRILNMYNFIYFVCSSACEISRILNFCAKKIAFQ